MAMVDGSTVRMDVTLFIVLYKKIEETFMVLGEFYFIIVNCLK